MTPTAGPIAAGSRDRHPALTRTGLGLPLLERLKHSDCIEQCPLSGVTRKTFARSEFFSV
jgi:hypothetical protein